MATKKVSALSALTSPAGTEELLINDGGTSKKITIANAVKATDLPTAPSGISDDTNKEYNLKLTDVSGTETLTWVEETDDDTTYSAGSSSALGLIKLEDDAVQTTAASAITTTSSRTYGLQVNSSGQGVVNVPWADTDTDTMGSGFTVSATTDTNPTTITEGEDLMFTAGAGITCETTADGTVTITNTSSGATTGFVIAMAIAL